MPDELTAARPPVPYSYRCHALRVVDGDTVDVQIDLGFDTWKIERVRLEGVDTPEIFGPNATVAGQAARTFVIDWLAFEPGLILQSLKYNAREKYGRVLGDFYRVRGDGTTDAVSLAQALRNANLQKVNA